MKSYKVNEIRGARARLCLTQQFMADNLGISVSSYRKKEKGITGFSDQEKIKITRLLRLTTDQVNDIFFNGELPIGNQSRKGGK